MITRFRAALSLSIALPLLAILFSPSSRTQTKINPNQIASGTLASNIAFTGTNTHTGSESFTGTTSLTSPTIAGTMFGSAMWAGTQTFESSIVFQANNTHAGIDSFAVQPIITATSNQLLLGTSPNQTTLNFPAPSGNITLTFPSLGNTITQDIASGTASMTTAGISAGACGTTVTASATGVLTTDTITVSRATAATYADGGGLTLNWWPTAGNVNFNYCNASAGTITPTAMTVNYLVTR